MKNTLTFIGLVILSVLYLIEVDFSKITYLNIIAFVIIALTLIPLLISIAGSIRQKQIEKAGKQSLKDQKNSKR